MKSKFSIHPGLFIALALSTFHHAQAQLAPHGSQNTPTLSSRSPDKVNSPTILRADLMPYSFDWEYVTTGTYHRHYEFSAVIANIDEKDADDVVVLIGMKVLASNEPEKYPVGKKLYAGWGIMEEPCEGYSLSVLEHGSFAIPRSVTKCEIYVIIDRPIEHLDDHWENDTGATLRGKIIESDELNNVSSPYLFNFLQQEMQVHPTRIPVSSR